MLTRACIALYAALLTSSASASPLPTNEPAKPCDSGHFTLISARSGDVNLHLRPINANGEGFWIDKPTASYCPESVVGASSCPSGDITSVAGGDGGLGMSTAVPGGQQVYVAPSGALSYTIAHSVSMPQGSIASGFCYTAGNQHDGGVGSLTGPASFVACPVEKDDGKTVYQIFAAINGFNVPNCSGINVATSARNTTDADAWEYV